MKKLSYIITVLLLSLILVAPVSALRSAVYFLGQADSFVFHPGSSWSDTDLFDSFKDAMPGDTLTETINVRNVASDCDYVKIYLKAEAQNDPTMADFLAQLRMKVTQSGTTIYQASPNQTDGLTSYKLLGQFAMGETTDLDIELLIPITLGSEYMHRSGTVDWTFLAECYENGEIVEPDEPDQPVTPNQPNTPRTIDLIIHYTGCFILSLVGLIIAVKIIRHLKAEKDQA